MDLPSLLAEQRKRFAAAKQRSQLRVSPTKSSPVVTLASRLDRHKERMRELSSALRDDAPAHASRTAHEAQTLQEQASQQNKDAPSRSTAGAPAAAVERSRVLGATTPFAVSSLYGSPIAPAASSAKLVAASVEKPLYDSFEDGPMPAARDRSAEFDESREAAALLDGSSLSDSRGSPAFGTTARIISDNAPTFSLDDSPPTSSVENVKSLQVRQLLTCCAALHAGVQLELVPNRTFNITVCIHMGADIALSPCCNSLRLFTNNRFGAAACTPCSRCDENSWLCSPHMLYCTVLFFMLLYFRPPALRQSIPASQKASLLQHPPPIDNMA